MYPIFVMKNIGLTIALALFAAPAFASYRVVSVPTLPLSMPGISGQAVKLPTVLPTTPKTLPSLPVVAPLQAPGLPIPVTTIRPGVELPGPANPVPMISPTARVALIKLGAVETAKGQDSDKQAERLGRIFDRTRDEETAGRPKGDEVRHTLPENDLLDEIGVTLH